MARVWRRGIFIICPAELIDHHCLHLSEHKHCVIRGALKAPQLPFLKLCLLPSLIKTFLFQGTIIHVWTETCLDMSKDKQNLVVNPCKRYKKSQQWRFSRYQTFNSTNTEAGYNYWRGREEKVGLRRKTVANHCLLNHVIISRLRNQSMDNKLVKQKCIALPI